MRVEVLDAVDPREGPGDGALPFMQWNVTCLERLLEETEWRVAQHNWHGAQEHFDHFRHRLEQHLTAESRVLAPLLAHLPQGSVPQGREAAASQSCLVALAQRASRELSQQSSVCAGALSDLRDALWAHQHRAAPEQRALDQMLGTRERRVQLVQALRSC